MVSSFNYISNAITGYTPGIVQADISTFTGGEYFNDPTKVTQAAKDYITGKSSLEDVAKSVGFKDVPTPDTPLTVQQQQQPQAQTTTTQALPPPPL